MRGTGLGLFVTHSLAEAHGGRVDHEPVTEGGSRFTRTLREAPGQSGRPDSV